MASIPPQLDPAILSALTPSESIWRVDPLSYGVTPSRHATQTIAIGRSGPGTFRWLRESGWEIELAHLRAAEERIRRSSCELCRAPTFASRTRATSSSPPAGPAPAVHAARNYRQC